MSFRIRGWTLTCVNKLIVIVLTAPPGYRNTSLKVYIFSIIWNGKTIKYPVIRSQSEWGCGVDVKYLDSLMVLPWHEKESQRYPRHEKESQLVITGFLPSKFRIWIGPYRWKSLSDQPTKVKTRILWLEEKWSCAIVII